MKSIDPLRRFLLRMIVGLFASSLVFAENLPLLKQKANSLENTALLSTAAIDQKLPTQNHPISHYSLTEITLSTFETLSSTEQQTVASLWGLTTSDYAHYLQLMENSPEGLYYREQHLDPSWILGMNAKNEEERRKYVTLAILHERERITKLLLFQRTFDQLQHELFPNDKPIQIAAKNNDSGIPVTCRLTE